MRLSLQNWPLIVITATAVAVTGVSLLLTDSSVVPVAQRMIKQRWYDPAEMMQKSDELKDKEKDFQAKINAKAEEFKKRAETIQQEGMKLQKKQSVISADALKQERAALEEQYSKLTSEAQFSEKKMQQELNEIRGEYERKVLGLIKEFKEKNDIDVIQPMIPGTFVNKELDVTSDLVEFINKKYQSEKSKKKDDGKKK